MVPSWLEPHPSDLDSTSGVGLRDGLDATSLFPKHEEVGHVGVKEGAARSGGGRGVEGEGTDLVNHGAGREGSRHRELHPELLAYTLRYCDRGPIHPELVRDSTGSPQSWVSPGNVT